MTILEVIVIAKALRELIASNKKTILSLSKEKGDNTSKNVELQKKNEDLHKKINNLQKKI